MFPSAGHEPLRSAIRALRLRQWFHYVPEGPDDTDCLDLSRFFGVKEPSGLEADITPLFPRFRSLREFEQDDSWLRQELPIALIGDTSMSYLSGVTMPTLLTMYERMDPAARTMCAMVPPMTPTHMYWDFDASVEKGGIKKLLAQHVLGQEKHVIDEFIDTMSTFFFEKMGRAPDWSGLHWESASNVAAGKFSLHAHLTTEAFASVDHHKRFMQAYVAYVSQPKRVRWLCVEAENPEHRGTICVSLVDDTVYTGNRVLRLAGCCKPGKTPLKLLRGAPGQANLAGADELSWREVVFRGMPALAIDLASHTQLLQFGESNAADRAKRIAPLPPLVFSAALPVSALLEYTYGTSLTSARGPSALHAWLNTFKYLHRGKHDASKAASYSHTLYYGGSLTVPVTGASMLQLHRAVAADFANKHLDAISEVATTSVFRAFFELDPPDSWVWTRDEFIAIARCAQWAAAQLGCVGGNGCELWVSTKNRGGSGVHLVFPQLGINLERMRLLRRLFLSRLADAGPVLDGSHDLHAPVNWSAIVDEQVAKQTGHVHLRKNLSVKLHPCSECAAANSMDSASTCRLRNLICNKKRRLEPSFYQLTFVLADDGVENHALTQTASKSVVMQLQRTSILSVSQQLHPGWAVPQDLREQPHPRARDSSSLKRKGVVIPIERDPKRYKSVGDLMAVAVGPDDEGAMQDLPATHPASTALLGLIRSTHARWAQVELSKVTLQIPARSSMPARTPRYFVDVRGTGAHSCLNRTSNKHPPAAAGGGVVLEVAGEHRSASIWFLVTPAAIWQRCRGSAAKSDNRISGQPCHVFAHKLCAVPLATSVSLFPQLL